MDEELETNPHYLEREERVLIITRRLFPEDSKRHFVGIVERCGLGAVRVRGYAFVYDTQHGGFVKRKSQSTRVFALDNHIILFVLPEDVELKDIRYEQEDKVGLIVTDGSSFKIELNEFNA